MCEHLEKCGLGDCILINIHRTSYFEPKDYGPEAEKEGWASTVSSMLVSASPFTETGELADLRRMITTLEAFNGSKLRKLSNQIIVNTDSEYIYRGITKIIDAREIDKGFSWEDWLVSEGFSSQELGYWRRLCSLQKKYAFRWCCKNEFFAPKWHPGLLRYSLYGIWRDGGSFKWSNWWPYEKAKWKRGPYAALFEERRLKGIEYIFFVYCMLSPIAFLLICEILLVGAIARWAGVL